MSQRLPDAPSNGTPATSERRAAEAPPGSRERSESDVTGWSPERDETPETREGRFHRAAQMRMAQPRTEEDVHTPWGNAAGPYGRDDRSGRDAAGLGQGPLMGEHDRTHSLDAPHTPREYRQWDRSGDGHRPEPARSPGARPQSAPPTSRHEDRAWDSAPRGSRASEDFSGHGGSEPSRGRPPAPARSGRWKKEPLTAREIMTRTVKSARLDSSLREVARIMKDEDCGIVPVVDERGRLRGVLTDRDLVVRTLAEGRPPDSLEARAVMTENVEAVTPDEDIHALIELMGRHQVRRVPVVERDDRLVGIISLADIATRADHDEELQNTLDRISSRRSFWSRLY